MTRRLQQDLRDLGPMDFSGALYALKLGQRVARASWKIPGKYVMLQSGEEMFDPDSGRPVAIKEHLIWKNAEGKFVPWVASQDAVLAEDWFIGESGKAPFAPETMPVEILGFETVEGEDVQTSFGSIEVPKRFFEAALDEEGHSVDYAEDSLNVHLGNLKGLSFHAHRRPASKSSKEKGSS